MIILKILFKVMFSKYSIMPKKIRTYNCILCKKEYASSGSLWFHNKKYHCDNTEVVCGTLKNNDNFNEVVCSTLKNNDNFNEVVCGTNEVVNKKNIIKCCFCNKIFNDRSNKSKHQKICKNKTNIIEENIKLKEELENIKTNNQIIPLNNINNGISNTNNGTINNSVNNNQKNIQNNIQNNSLYIAQLGAEKINYKAKDIRKIARDGLNGAITCVQKTHFDKDKPENHSFLTSSLAGHYCTAINHKTQKPETVPKKDLFWTVLGASFKILEGIAIQLECNSELREQIPVNEQEKLNDLIKNKNKFFEKKNWNSFYESINSMSYNYKDLILSTWNTLKVPEMEADSDTESEPDVKVVTEFNDSDSDDDFNLNILQH